MKFIGNVLATVVGIFVFLVLSFVGLLLIGSLIGGNHDSVVVEENSVIQLDLSEISKDYAENLNVIDFSPMSSVSHNGWVDVINAIEAAKTDDNIKGISILNSPLSLGLAQTTALRKKLQEFKKTGKFIVAYADSYSQKEYYLSSVADTIFLNPVGELDFKGLSAEVLYMKNLQENSGIKMEVIRHGKFKSAVEPFLTQEMSPENRQQLTDLLNGAWNTIATDISISRKINNDTLNAIATRVGGRNARLALKNKLVDKLVYEDQYHNGIKRALKVEYSDDYKTIDIVDYAKNVATTATDYSKKDRIAVIFAQGDIMPGEGDSETIGEGYMRDALNEAVEDENIKAIVIRIDSPGGSALTSELIWRAIELAKKSKPVVVSMGNVAASGGYYIACNANRIFAEPTTITGSIGVFGTIPNASQLSEKIGINAEQVSTHPNHAEYSFFQPLNDSFREMMTESVKDVYETFVSRVAKGRKLTPQQVDEIGQGRIWIGTQAQKIGLVDEIGGLDKAIAYAAKMSKTSSYRIQQYPEFEKTLDEVLNDFQALPFAKTQHNILKEHLGNETYQIYSMIKKANKQKGVQAAVPYYIKIK